MSLSWSIFFAVLHPTFIGSGERKVSSNLGLRKIPGPFPGQTAFCWRRPGMPLAIDFCALLEFQFEIVWRKAEMEVRNFKVTSTNHNWLRKFFKSPFYHTERSIFHNMKRQHYIECINISWINQFPCFLYFILLY